MSRGYWRTGKRTEPLSPGKCATSRVQSYVKMWEERCYPAGIPDEVPPKVAASGRAPSWRQVAIAILKNDLHFYALGYSTPSWESQKSVYAKAYFAYNGHFPVGQQLELPL